MKRRTFLTHASLATAAASLGRSPAAASSLPGKRTMTILGSDMAYVDAGRGAPVVFLHGNPTSSYLWRNIIPHVSGSHRAIAPDLIGMGDSAKPEIAYRYGDHAAHLHGLLDALDLTDATLVLHDWGSALGLDWASRNAGRLRGIAFMEAMLPPAMPFASYEAMGPFADLFRTLRTEGPGEELVLGENFFVEKVLGKMGVATPLDEETLAAYRAPFPTPESRLPTLQWPREIPIGGRPADVDAVMRSYSEWFLASDLPKLMFHADPGALVPPEAARWLESNLSNLETVFLGAGAHFLQEDHAPAIGQNLARWLTQI